MWLHEEDMVGIIQIEEVIKQNEKSEQKQFKTRRFEQKQKHDGYISGQSGSNWDLLLV